MINDRLLLGLVAGLGGNLVKLAIGEIGKKYKYAEIDGPEIAAGIFIPPHKLTGTSGKVVGYLADATISGILGTATVYGLSVTGKNQGILKGAIMGQIMWEALYTILGSFGGSQVKAYSPKTVLNEFFSHTVFGAVAAAIAVNLGDEGLFTGVIPLDASAPAALRDDKPHSPGGIGKVPARQERVDPAPLQTH